MGLGDEGFARRPQEGIESGGVTLLDGQMKGASMRLFKWALVNGAFLGLAYAGFILNMGGAKNVLFLFAWVNIVLSVFMLTKDAIKILKEKGRPVPQWLNVSYDFLLAAVFAWFGAWVTGLFWIIHMWFQECAYSGSQKSL